MPDNFSNPRLSLAVIERLLPQPARSVAEIKAHYSDRQLKDGARVTRIAPSPTGFIHIGTLYAALICKMLARQTNGVYFLRIEDTDSKREMAGASDLIMAALDQFDLRYDEGPLPDGEIGLYGPYIQSHRQEIYNAFVRQLLETGKAYPCFMTPEEQEEMRAQQTAQKVRPGYYGKWALWRDQPEADVVAALDAGKSYVIRFRSEGDITRRRTVTDLVKGAKALPENDTDIVVRKQTGLPTYHLAHVVDDYLMGTNPVIRADEWFASCTLHIQLAEALGIAPFTYAHLAPIQKMDGSSRRKLSKRHDPEATVTFYQEQGYPIPAVIDYMLNLANSSFEDWRAVHQQAPYLEFPFDMTRLPKNSGALLSLEKLDDISKQWLAQRLPEQVYEALLAWAKTYHADLAACLAADPDYAIRVLSIERDNNKRKDMSKLADAPDLYGFFFDQIFAEIARTDVSDTEAAKVAPSDRAAICEGFLALYDANDSQDEWFAKLKSLAEQLGFTSDMKAYRKNPEAYKGSIADVAMIIRVALTGRNRSPNLFEMIQVMGWERVQTRLGRFL